MNDITKNGIECVINLPDETVEVSREEYNYISQLAADNDVDIGDILTLLDVNVVICALFAMSKFDDAWELIDTDFYNIDFIKITSECPFFRLKPTAFNVFERLYASEQIDDDTYAYFQCIGNKFWDIGFWTEYLKNENSATKILEKIHQSYNGLNPLDVGLMEPCEEINKIIYESLMPNELIDDFILGSKPAIKFTVPEIISLYTNGNLSNQYVGTYATLAFIQLDESVLKVDAAGNTSEAVQLLWSTFVNSFEDLKHIEFNDLKMLLSFIDYMKPILKVIAKEIDLGESAQLDYVNYAISNSKVFYQYPNIILNYVSDMIDTFYITLDPNKVGLIEYPRYAVSANIMASTMDNVKFENVEIMYPLLGSVHVAYNSRQNMYYVSGMAPMKVDVLKEKLKNILDNNDISNYTMIESSLAEGFQSQDDILEFSYALNNFIDR